MSEHEEGGVGSEPELLKKIYSVKGFAEPLNERACLCHSPLLIKDLFDCLMCSFNNQLSHGGGEYPSVMFDPPLIDKLFKYF